MSNEHTTASAAHKQAAAEHYACADNHTKAAQCYESHQDIDAKLNSINAMKCCQTANKQSSNACACSAK